MENSRTVNDFSDATSKNNVIKKNSRRPPLSIRFCIIKWFDQLKLNMGLLKKYGQFMFFQYTLFYSKRQFSVKISFDNCDVIVEKTNFVQDFLIFPLIILLFPIIKNGEILYLMGDKNYGKIDTRRNKPEHQHTSWIKE